MPKKYGKRKQTPNLHETQLYDKVTKLESSILSDLQYLNKKRNLKFDCVHCYDEEQQAYDPKKNYYEEFWKSYMINMVLMKRYEEYRDWMKKMTRKMQNIEVIDLFDQQSTYAERKKAMQPIDSKRRKKNSSSESSDFECLQCGKRYKDGDSLNIHLSIKHKPEDLQLEAKIEQLHHHYIQNSDSEDKKYYQEEQQ